MLRVSLKNIVGSCHRGMRDKGNSSLCFRTINLQLFSVTAQLMLEGSLRTDDVLMMVKLRGQHKITIKLTKLPCLHWSISHFPFPCFSAICLTFAVLQIFGERYEQNSNVEFSGKPSQGSS